MSTIETIIKGGTVESYKYKASLRSDPARVSRKIEHTKEKMKKKKPSGYFKELLPSLVGGGYISQSTMKSSHQYAVRENRWHLVHDVCSQYFVPHPLWVRLQTPETLLGI